MGYGCEKWYCDRITDELTDYEEVKIDVPYELKEHYNEKYSIRWSPDVKSWITSLKITQDIENEE